jgi:hypothetical protein
VTKIMLVPFQGTRGAMAASHTGVRPATLWRKSGNLLFNF